MLHDPIVLISLVAFLVAGFVFSATRAIDAQGRRRPLTAWWQRWSFPLTVSMVVNLYLGVSLVDLLFPRPPLAPPPIYQMTIVELPASPLASPAQPLRMAEAVPPLPELPALTTFTYTPLISAPAQLTPPPTADSPPRQVAILDPGARGDAGGGAASPAPWVSSPGGSTVSGGNPARPTRSEGIDAWALGEGPTIAFVPAGMDHIGSGNVAPRMGNGLGNRTTATGPLLTMYPGPGGPGLGMELPRPGGVGQGSAAGSAWVGSGFGGGWGSGTLWGDGPGSLGLPVFDPGPRGFGDTPVIALGAAPASPRLSAPGVVAQPMHATHPARVLTHTPPEYPREAYDEGVEGTVVVRVFLRLDGTVRAVQPEALPRDRRLYQAVLSAVQRWSYTPATVDGLPVESQEPVLVRVEFRRRGITITY